MDNIWSDDWETGPEDDWSGGGGARSGSAPPGGMLGATVYELPPEGFVVYHIHHVIGGAPHRASRPADAAHA